MNGAREERGLCSSFRLYDSLKGNSHFQKPPIFIDLDEKPLWKLKESKKPHLKIFSRSRNKGIFVYG